MRREGGGGGIGRGSGSGGRCGERFGGTLDAAALHWRRSSRLRAMADLGEGWVTGGSGGLKMSNLHLWGQSL